MLGVLERSVVLGEGHRARVEPDVDHLGHALHPLAALGAGESDLVHVGTVWVLELRSRELLELLERADARECGSRSQRQTGSGVPQ